MTLALARGASETEVMNRTGHRSSQMLHRYRRAIDLAREQALGDLTPMHEAIPDLAAVVVTDEEGVA